MENLRTAHRPASYEDFLSDFLAAIEPVRNDQSALRRTWNEWILRCPVEWKNDFEDDAAVVSALQELGQAVPWKEIEQAESWSSDETEKVESWNGLKT